MRTVLLLISLSVCCFAGVGCGELEDQGFSDTPLVDEDDPTIPNAQPTPVFNPTPSELTNPRCHKVMGPDGAGGFLWKAESENTGNLVILFPAQFQRPFKSVLVYGSKRGAIWSCLYRGKANGNRQHWYCPHPGEKYDGKITAQDIDQRCEWKVPRPADRQD